MANTDVVSSYRIDFDTNASDVAPAAARNVESLATSVNRAKDRIASMSTAMRQLRGRSAEVMAAKQQLTAAIDKERATVTSSELALLKMGTSSSKVAREMGANAKELAAAEKGAKGLGAAAEAIGGPVGRVAQTVKGLGERFSGLSTGAKVAVVGLALFVAAAVAAAAAAYKVTRAVAEFVVTSSNMARNQQLAREAVALSAEDARRFGTQVDALAKKVPTAADELNKMAVDMRAGGLAGQALVDTMNAVGQASAAVGDNAGGKMRELVERGKQTKRFYLGIRDTLGTGLEFNDVAEALAKKMGVGIDKARAALQQGRVRLADGAAALADAANAKFGSINLRKLTDLDVVGKKFQERLAKLASGMNLDRVGKVLERILHLFDENTSTGQGLQMVFQGVGDTMTSAFEGGEAPFKKLVKALVIGALDIQFAMMKVEEWMLRAFGPDALSGLLQSETTMNALKGTAILLGAALVATAVAVGTIVAAFVYVAAKIGEMVSKFTGAIDAIKKGDWKGAAKMVVEGLVAGLKSMMGPLGMAADALASVISIAFKKAMDMHSPSKKFFRYGVHIGEGAEGGMLSKKGDVAQAAEEMAPATPALPAANGGGGVSSLARAPIVVNVPITIEGSAAGASSASQASFLVQLQEAVERAVAAALAASGVA